PQDVRRHRIYFVIGERFRRRPGHRPAGEVEYHGGIRPVAADRLDRRSGAGDLTADQPCIGLAFALVAMTCGALLRIDDSALGGGAAAGRQADAVWPDADVPWRRIGWRDR